MPKPVQLGSKKPTPATKEALLARVTGANKPQPAATPARRVLTPPPPSARPLPPGVTGDLPMPAGRVVGGIAPSSLTAAEREALESIGWTEDVPIPENFADAFDSIKAERLAEDVVVPVRSGTVPALRPVPIDTVDASAQARLRQVMSDMAKQNQADAEQARHEAEMQTRASAIPGLTEARRVAAAVVGQKPSAESEEPVFEVDAPVGTRIAPTVEAQRPSATGAAAHPANCPHCGWNQGMVDVAEPAYEEKMAFLHAMLGQKSYARATELFGGAVIVVFRTLTLGELEALYKQTYADQKAGQIDSEVDYYEKLNRYRLCLQVQQLKAEGPGGFLHDLPDGLDRASNPDAVCTWQDDNDAPDAGATLLPMVEDHVFGTVLKQEALLRVVMSACNDFNRMVAKLEAMADNSDFWRKTGGPS